MRLKNRAVVTIYLLTFAAAMFILIPLSVSNPETYGPRLDTLYGRFIESTSAQKAALYAGEADIWFDVSDPETIREINDDGFAVTATQEAFLYDHIDFNIRDQLNPSGDGSPWRTGPEEISRVILEGYTAGPYDESIDFDVYTTGFIWLGSLYATGAPAWVTPRWTGDASASDLYPKLLTETGIKDFEVMVYFYDPMGHGGLGNTLDCLRLKIEYASGAAEYVCVDGYTVERQQWAEVGASPFLDAPDDGSYIEGTTDGAQHRWFTFEDPEFSGSIIDYVQLEGYTDGPYQELIDFDVYTKDFTWLGSLYATGAPAWVTPRWVGTDKTSDLEPALLTAAGISDFEALVYFYDPMGYGGLGNILDCLRLKIVFGNGTAEYVYVDGFVAEKQQWIEVGASPFLDAPDDGSYIEGTTDGAQHRWFTFEDTDFEDPGAGGFFSYSGEPYTNYVPLNNTYFRHAVAHCIPKDEIVAVVYGGISAAAVDSLIPEAQRAWFTPGIDGHPLSMGDPLASTVWDGAYLHHDACSILRAGGFSFDPEGTNPVAKYSPDDPDGAWVDPLTGDWMNHISFAGVSQEFSPVAWSRDDMCARNWRSIGLPIEHVGVDYGYLTDVMLNYYLYDMYALEWEVDRFPNHLYSFFHSSNNIAPGGYNIPGIENTELDGYLETVQHSVTASEIKEAAANASAMLAELCVSLPVVTRQLFAASAVARAPGPTDTLQGIVNCPGYGQANDWTFYDLHWRGLVTESNPYGIGGSANMIVGSEPSNYHPAFASTPDEWRILDRVFEGLIGLDPYTHEDVRWLATDWWIEYWDYGGTEMGMNTTFWLRDDIYYHDGVHFDAYTCKFSLEWLRDMQISRARAVWQNLHEVEVHSDYCFSVYHTVTSIWTFYDIADWAPLIPPHIYFGTDVYFRPEDTVNPLNGHLTCLVGTGPYMVTDLYSAVGGYVELTAYRENADLGITTHWFMGVEEEDELLTQMFHWKGDVNYDGIVDDLDLARVDAAFGTSIGDPRFDPDADLYYDDRINMRDASIVAKGWGMARKYPQLPDDLMPRMIETIEDWNLQQGTENSLTSTVDAALDLLNAGNEIGAIHKLMDFINQVEAKRGKKLTDRQADYLIAEAQRIIDLI
ncbi:MAG: hypothetical protein JSV64_06740 [Candidatus Bathyarchaeota archaeon]|nr:MAG: hypothetical protein JSV64_06740 [Candidatus Bathyarchaeota archaeon]